MNLKFIKIIYPPNSFFIIILFTILFGLILNIFLKKKYPKKKFKLSLPFAISYLFISFLLLLFLNEIPIKIYAESKQIDSNLQKNNNFPNMGNAFVYVIKYLISLIINLIIWTLCIIIIYKSKYLKKTNLENDILDDVFNEI